MKFILIAGSVCVALLVYLQDDAMPIKGQGRYSFSDTTKQKGKPFDYYPDEVISDTAKLRFEKDFKKGKVLYGLNCAKCHNVKEKSKLEIPDFSLPQLMDYEIRVQYPAHEEDMKETNLSHDELDLVVQYLRYKKRSGIPYRPK